MDPSEVYVPGTHGILLLNWPNAFIVGCFAYWCIVRLVEDYDLNSLNAKLAKSAGLRVFTINLLIVATLISASDSVSDTNASNSSYRGLREPVHFFIFFYKV